MADVDMTDAPVEKKKVAKGGDADNKGEKKRFEVKKVGWHMIHQLCYSKLLLLTYCNL